MGPTMDTCRTQRHSPTTPPTKTLPTILEKFAHVTKIGTKFKPHYKHGELSVKTTRLVSFWELTVESRRRRVEMNAPTMSRMMRETRAQDLLGDILKLDLTKGGDQMLSIKLREFPPANPFLAGEFLIGAFSMEIPEYRFERVQERKREKEDQKKKKQRERIL